MILTTTPYIEGRHILEYKGIVIQKAEHHPTKVFGPDDEDYQRTYNRAANDLKQYATELGANAIIGLQVCITDDERLLLNLTGTAVVIE